MSRGEGWSSSSRSGLALPRRREDRVLPASLSRPSRTRRGWTGRPRRRRAARHRIHRSTATPLRETLLVVVTSLAVGQAGCALYQPVDPSLLWHPFEASAYCDEGFTASGAYVRDGIVAADPRVLPLGSVIDIRIDDRVLEEYEVMDTGGAVKGYKIDIWMSSCDAAVEFGRRAVKVRVRKRGTLHG